MSKPRTYDEAPQEIRDAVEQIIKTYGPDPSLLAGAIVSATCRAILAAKAEEREVCIATANAERVLPFYVNPAEATEDDKAYDMAIDHVLDAIRKRGEG